MPPKAYVKSFFIHLMPNVKVSKTVDSSIALSNFDKKDLRLYSNHHYNQGKHIGHLLSLVPITTQHMCKQNSKLTKWMLLLSGKNMTSEKYKGNTKQLTKTGTPFYRTCPSQGYFYLTKSAARKPF